MLKKVSLSIIAGTFALTPAFASLNPHPDPHPFDTPATGKQTAVILLGLKKFRGPQTVLRTIQRDVVKLIARNRIQACPKEISFPFGSGTDSAGFFARILRMSLAERIEVTHLNLRFCSNVTNPRALNSVLRLLPNLTCLTLSDSGINLKKFVGIAQRFRHSLRNLQTLKLDAHTDQEYRYANARTDAINVINVLPNLRYFGLNCAYGYKDVINDEVTSFLGQVRPYLTIANLHVNPYINLAESEEQEEQDQ